MNNLHISLTELRNESRVIKEVTSIEGADFFTKIYIASFHGDGILESESVTDNIQINRFKLKTRKLGKTFFIRSIKYFEFILRILFFYSNKNISVINVHSLGLLPLGYVYSKIWNTKIVYDAHELETETNGLSGFKKKVLKIIEKVLIKKVDGIVVVSEKIADWYENEYDIERPKVVLNTPCISEIEKNNYFRKNFSISDKSKIFIYQGALFRGRGIELIIETFKERQDNRAVIVFMGYGELDKEIKHAADISANIFYHQAVPSDVVHKYTASADVGVSLIENTCLSYYYCMPNKLFEYAMAGLPVVVSNMPEMSDFILKHNMGLVIGESSIISLNEVVDKLLNMNIDLLSENSRKAALLNSWETQREQYLSIYSKF